MESIALLDSTLRDGGLGLEDASSKGYSHVVFSDSVRQQILAALANSKIDLVEIGSIEISSEDKRRFAIYKNIEQASLSLPRQQSNGTRFAVLYRGPDTPIDDIPIQDGTLCEFVRVIIRYSELRKSLNFCYALSTKGYKVCVQPMLTMRYSDDELNAVISAANDMQAFALYFVDSYGYMEADDVLRFTDLYASKLNSTTRIGFHAHNNTNQAFSNAKAFIRYANGRDIMLDSCAIGLGQGAGNLQTELISPFLNKNFGKHYDYDSILDVCDIVENLMPCPQCGYSTMYLLPAINKTAYKYATDLRLRYNMPYRKINEILRCMPPEMRHRYTIENLKVLLAKSKMNVQT